MSVDSAYQALLGADVQVVVALPDSLLAPLCRRLMESSRIRYIQCQHESDCVGLAAGLTLCGTRALVIMENSGLRNACETIARLGVSHRLFATFLISHRGGFGENNWWGLAHHTTMVPLFDLLGIRWASVSSVRRLESQLKEAFAMTMTGYCSAALVAERPLLKEISG